MFAEPIYSVLRGGRISEEGFASAFSGFSLKSVYRAGFAFVGILFVLFHFIAKIPDFYNFMFKYRYVLAVTVFFVLVIGQIHFSSVAMFDYHIQPGYGSEFIAPIFGSANPIRSDEWAVSTPIQLAAQFDPEPFGRYNYITRGTATENMHYGLTFNLASLAFPFSVFHLFGAEYGISARWVGLLIMTFMISLEFSYIITKKNRLLALVGACLITFSPFFQWWSYVLFIPAGLGVLVCFYYFINAETKVRKILLALGAAVFLSMFIVNLYPPWQVPASYLYLGLAVWIIVDNWERIKQLKKLDYVIIALTAILVTGVVGVFLYESREYLAGITNTVYPGARIETGGGVAFADFTNRMMNAGLLAPMSVRNSFLYTNISEFGGFYTLFPIPILFASFLMIKEKRVDLLSLILIIVSVFIGTYIIVGWPQVLARIFLMSFSTSIRVLDILLFVQIFLFLRIMSWKANHNEISENNENAKPQSTKPQNTKCKPQNINYKAQILTISGAIAVSACLTFIAHFLSRTTFYYPIPAWYFVISFVGFSVVLYSIFDFQRNKKIFMSACIYLICFSLFTFITVHPIMRGLDVIYSKPLSEKISELAVNPDEKWISLDHVLYGPPFLVASGASTINSTNFYPNLDLWHELDPERNYENIYNRYAHVSVELTSDNTSFVLYHADHMLLRLSYSDLYTAGVRFIHTREPLQDNETVRFVLLYDEGGSRIYAVE